MMEKRMWLGLIVVLATGWGQAAGQVSGADRMNGALSSMAGAETVLGGVASSLDAMQGVAGGQPRAEASMSEVLRNLASRAGVAFVGQVLRVEHEPGFVEIVFTVQQPVLGAVGGTYTLREWSGLWAPGEQRYTPGERAMVFLHTPNAAGMSSPVDGMEGVVPVVLQGADEAPLLDVRWLATRVVRPQGAPIVDADNGAMALADATAAVAVWNKRVLPEPVLVALPVGVRPLPVGPQPIGIAPRFGQAMSSHVASGGQIGGR